MEAAAKGASDAIPLVLGITAIIIVFISFVDALNSWLYYFGCKVSGPDAHTARAGPTSFALEP